VVVAAEVRSSNLAGPDEAAHYSSGGDRWEALSLARKKKERKKERKK